jgi:hypothetical protein
MSDPLDWMSLANKKAKGKRPEYFDAPEDDRFFSILLALVGEVSVMRQRLDTIERLLETKGSISRSDIEAYSPDEQAALERGVLIRDYIYRVMRGPQQAVEALREAEPSVEEVSRNLKDM